MQEMLAKIIKMDEKAREMKEKAEQEKINSEQEIEELRQQIYDDYIMRAKERVEKNIAIDKKIAQADLEKYRREAETVKEEMHRLYDENADRWVDTIVDHVLA